MSLPEEIPLDISHPAVRDYIALTRLQVLTPLSLLISIATVMVTTFIISPGLGTISKIHPTPISPSPALVGVYLVAIFAGQIGYCVLLVLASKPETKQALIKGAGFSLVLANWIMAAWAVTWSLQLFLPSTILLGILTLTLLYSNLVLLIYHAPTNSRPLDTLLIHAPMRLFLLLPAMLLLPHSILITTGKTWAPGHPNLFKSYEWQGFAVVLVTNLVGLVIVVLHRDLVWCIGALWINVCIWSERPKSMAVQATSILFTILHPIALIAILVWMYMRSRRKSQEGEGEGEGLVEGGGAIRLPDDEQEQEHAGNVGRVWS